MITLLSGILCNFSVLVTVGFVVNVLKFFYDIYTFQELLDCVVQEAAK